MSLSNFITRQQERLAEIEAAMRRQVAKDRGKQVRKNLKKLIEERDVVLAAINRASARGITNGITQIEVTFDGGGV